jgi:hypothetical protein
MKKALVLLILLTAPAALAARATVGNQPFPNDFKPHPCAPSDACASLSQGDIVAAASTLRGYSLQQDWVDKHWNEMIELIRPTCRKLATCYATPDNSAIFCMDLLFPEFWSVCDRYPKDSEMFEQCSYFTRIYSFRADLRDKKTWKEAQTCAKAAAPRNAQPKAMEVSMTPAKIGDDYTGKFVVYALDPETRVPIQALIEMQDTPLSARAPGGKPWTNYDIEWPVTFRRVPRADGHTDLVPPTITVSADGYAPVTLTMPVTPGKAIVEMTPAIDQLKRGKNTVTVIARDSVTGKPVELRVLAGETILGYTNKPFELELKKGEKRPEIWATSLFHRYDDVVIAPAEK